MNSERPAGYNDVKPPGCTCSALGCFSKPPCAAWITKPLTLPTDSKERKKIPLATGCLYYFPAALAEVAKLSRIGNEKHNPGQPLHHARGKSMDHADCLLRHQVDVGEIDPETGLDHAVEVAWRALAQLQELLESRGAPLARGARAPFEFPFVPFTPKHAADCKDQNCDRRCMPANPAPSAATHCKSCGGTTPGKCQDC